MTLALKSPEIVHDIVSVDNAPLDAVLLSNFGKYIQGMRKIEEAGVTRQAEADKILHEYEEVSTDWGQSFWSFLTGVQVPHDSPIFAGKSVSTFR